MSKLPEVRTMYRGAVRWVRFKLSKMTIAGGILLLYGLVPDTVGRFQFWSNAVRKVAVPLPTWVHWLGSGEVRLAVVLLGIVLILLDQRRIARKAATERATAKIRSGLSIVATGTVSRVVPVPEGPRVLLEYSLKEHGARGHADPLDKEFILLNDGTEAALNVQISEIRQGKWTATFAPIPMLEKGSRLAVRPSEMFYKDDLVGIAISHFGMLVRASGDEVSTDVDPISIPVVIKYDSASLGERLQTTYFIEYWRARKEAKVMFLHAGREVLL